MQEYSVAKENKNKTDSKENLTKRKNAKNSLSYLYCCLLHFVISSLFHFPKVSF